MNTGPIRGRNEQEPGSAPAAVPPEDGSMVQQSKKRLGRGLAALIGEEVSEEGFVQDARSLRHVPIESVHQNPRNPRRHFDKEELEELARSIRQRGMLQPLVVRPWRGMQHLFEIVAGERRWRAAQQAGLHDIPVIVRELSDAEALEIALVENIQRTDLNPLEEAEGYRQLTEGFGYTQQQLADAVGKSRSHIANTLRLLGLPDEVRAHLRAGRLTAGHARALIATEDPGGMAQEIVARGLNVRDTEALVRTAQSVREDGPKPGRKPPEKDTDTLALERSLAEALGLKVEISHRGRRGGQLRISYGTLDQLDELCRRLHRKAE